MSSFLNKKEGYRILPACSNIEKDTGLPAFDVLEYGAGELVELLRSLVK